MAGPDPANSLESKYEKLNALPLPGIGLAVLPWDLVPRCRIENNCFFRRSVFGGRFRIEHLQKIAATSRARDHSIHRRGSERRSFALRSLFPARGSRRFIGFREERASRDCDYAKNKQAGFHR
jgi:hypothetical protein